MNLVFERAGAMTTPRAQTDTPVQERLRQKETQITTLSNQVNLYKDKVMSMLFMHACITSCICFFNALKSCDCTHDIHVHVRVHVDHSVQVPTHPLSY